MGFCVGTPENQRHQDSDWNQPKNLRVFLESTKIFWGFRIKVFFILGKDSNSAGELKFPKFFFDKTWNLFFWICVSVVGVYPHTFGVQKPLKAFVEMLQKLHLFSKMKFCLNEAVGWFVWRIPKRNSVDSFFNPNPQHLWRENLRWEKGN